MSSDDHPISESASEKDALHPGRIPEVESPKPSRAGIGARRVIAILLSLVLVGGGQIVMGRPIRAGCLIVAWLPAVLFAPYIGFWSVVVVVLVYLGALADTIFLKLNPRGPTRWPWVVGLLIVLYVCLSVIGYVNKAYWVAAYKVTTFGNAPTLLPNDRFCVKMGYEKPRRGDLVIMRIKDGPRNNLSVKRVVGVAGDTITIHGKKLWINGKKVEKKKIGPCTSLMSRAEFSSDTYGPCVIYREVLDGKTYNVAHDETVVFGQDKKTFDVPKDRIFVLGDGRDWSGDSRMFGAQPIKAVVGKLLFIFWSSGPEGIRWSRIGRWVE